MAQVFSEEQQQAFGFFRPDKEAMDTIRAGLKASGYVDDETVDRLVDKLESRPLLRWFVLRQIQKEARSAGAMPSGGRIDWAALADFIKEIAPVILEILMMFL